MTDEPTVPARGPIVTTSWDDGVEWDLRLAEFLAERGLLGTFYIADCGWREHRISDSSVMELGSMGMEIGGHTVTHPDLTRLREDEVRSELLLNKHRLEAILGEGLNSFCYPFGLNDRNVSAIVAEVGYKLGRTNVSHRIRRESDSTRQSVTWQMYPHSKTSYLRHAVRSLNVGGALRMMRWRSRGTEMDALERLSASDLDGAVIHLWGHAWEVESMGAWSQLGTLLDRLAELPRVQFATNYAAYVAVPGND